MKPKKTKAYFRWAGGKQDLAPKIIKKLNASPSCNAYHEPFLGAGTIFLNRVGNEPAFLSDINEELIIAMQTVRDNPHELLGFLDSLDTQKSKEDFLRIRAWDRVDDFKSMSKISRAARFIYLQKLGFNGLWRENKKGQYNTSYGKDSTKQLYDTDTILNCSTCLQGTVIRHQGFEESISKVKSGDTVYLDPPYIPVTSSVFNYSSAGFNLSDQERLEDALVHLNSIGAYYVLSNSFCDKTKHLYRNHNMQRVKTRRNISQSNDGRKEVWELLVSNF